MERMYDLVIRGGTVVDGSGLPGYRADVGITGGRITRIGRIPREASQRGTDEIDAAGHLVTPGFIDGHTHMDAQVFWDEQGSCSAWHGVTTVVMGNCGFTLAPARADARHLVTRNLERAEEISAAAMEQGIAWTWETFPEYLDAVDALPKAVNYAAQVGHSALRTWAMGERAFDGPATDAELAEMEAVLREGLRAGAVGFTTTRNDNHETADGRPVASRLASWDEVRRLVGVLAEEGAGVFEITHEPGAGGPDEVREEYFARLRTLAAETGVPFNFGVSGRNGVFHGLRLLDSIADAGGVAYGLSHSRGINTVTSFRTKTAFDKLPLWSDIRALPLDEQRKAYSDPETRARLVEIALNGPYGRAIGAEARKPDFDRMRVYDRPMPPLRTVNEVAAERGVGPVDLILDLALETDFHQLFIQAVVSDDPADLLPVMRHPRAVMTFTDNGAHVGSMADASLHTLLLGHWVRGEGAFGWEEAIRMITYAPALAWGFHDRGLLREGMAADVNVIDPETVAPLMPVVAYDIPGGAYRLRQRARGIPATVVGGQVAFRDGEHTGALPGRLLRGPLASRD
ncbi:amidohydrolase family protein [Yinghuangia aomiensis]|uniref:Amidohydrolase family protein n=2 Tax=Yinghuangia aomiensis TaxID=676205 RepID=A0ABP9GSA0_9ACTN